jgi:hypothetical protein
MHRMHCQPPPPRKNELKLSIICHSHAKTMQNAISLSLSLARARAPAQLLIGSSCDNFHSLKHRATGVFTQNTIFTLHLAAWQRLTKLGSILKGCLHERDFQCRMWQPHPTLKITVCVNRPLLCRMLSYHTVRHRNCVSCTWVLMPPIILGYHGRQCREEEGGHQPPEGKAHPLGHG